MAPSADEMTVRCLICGKAVLLRQEQDGVIVLPDTAAFCREHADCLRGKGIRHLR